MAAKRISAAERHWWHLYADAGVVFFSIVIAYLLVRSGVVHSVVGSFAGMGYLGSFLAGIFFTSAFTTAPAIAILSELTQEFSTVTVALLGGAGAVIGDYVLFYFLRDRMTSDLEFLMSHSKMKRLPGLFKTKLGRTIMPFIGALIIASPLPDELGIALMGLARTSNKMFLPLSFTLNVLGIILIGLVSGGKF